jgi:succinoglycan biosynthesis protein ExoA
MQHNSKTTDPDVTVAIPAYNEEHDIGRILKQFSRSAYPNVVEILVADGGSTDRTREIVEELARDDERIRLINNPGKIQSAGLNEIIKIAKGYLILRADAHSLYAEDYIEASVAAIQKSGALNAGGAQRFVARTPFQTGIALAVRTFLGSGGASYRDPDFSGYADTVYIGCYKTEALRTLGGFSTTNGPNEDAEMNLRLSKMQTDAIFISSDIQTWYFPRGSWSSLFKQYFHYGRGRKLTQLKHPDSNPIRSRIPFYSISFMLLWLIVDYTIFGGKAFSGIALIIAILIPPLLALNETFRSRSVFQREIWKGARGDEPGLFLRFILTTICLYTMPVAHFTGYLYQSVKYLVTRKTEF